MPQYPTGGQWGGSPYNNPSMNRGWRANQQSVQRQTPNNQSSVSYWNDLLGQGFAQQPTQVTAQQMQTPTMSNNWQQYLQGVNNPFQQVQAGNVSAPQMSQDWQKYLQAGTQNINAAGLQDTSKLLQSYEPLLQRQQEQGFAGAAARAGKTGMWGSPYASALGREAASASAQRANITNQYLYQASEAAAGRQLQAEIQNRQNQLQAAGMSAEQARAQAQMELSAAQGNQQAGLQAGMANQQAQIQQRAQQLQAAGISADQAWRQAQNEIQVGTANQSADLAAQQANQQAMQRRLDQLLQGQQQSMTYGIQRDQLSQQQQEERNRQIQNMMNQFMSIYGDIMSPDDLWKWIDNWFNTGGQGGMPPVVSTPGTTGGTGTGTGAAPTYNPYAWYGQNNPGQG